MTRSLSQKFRFFTFVCIALLAYVHGYNLNVTYLAPFSTVSEPLTFTTFFEYFISNGLLRFRIPMLFIISGYLYATYDHRPYGQQVKKRFRTLIVPYFIWSAFGLLLTFLLQQFPYTAKVVTAAALDQLNDNRPYAEIGWAGMLERFVLAPVSYQLWFIVALFFFNLAYPCIRWLVTKIPYIWLPLTFLLFFVTVIQIPLFDFRGLFFFSLGVWIQKQNIDIEKEPKWFSLGWALILFIGLCIIKTFMAFEFEATGWASWAPLIIIHQVAVVAGIMAMWFGADKIIHWCVSKPWFNYASGFSFFIFGMHVPLLPYVMKWAVMNTSLMPMYRLLCFLLVPLLVLCFCIVVGTVLRKFVPKAYMAMTGGRGF
ncbi:MAG: acyltransferase [Chitinophagaceae bacterium]|nr:acyltransferase [Chitinophagaceae bacterium]